MRRNSLHKQSLIFFHRNLLKTQSLLKQKLILLSNEMDQHRKIAILDAKMTLLLKLGSQRTGLLQDQAQNNVQE